MATDAADATGGFGHVSRIRGILFANLTRVASAVGVVALLLLLVYTTLDAFQPFTADPEWYAVLAGTFAVPTLAVLLYCSRRPGALGVAGQAVGATLAGTTVATVLALWLGGQLALLTVLGVVVPSGLAIALLFRERQALTVGLQAAGIVVAGAGLGSVGAFFLGEQATLVAAVAVGLPAALLARYFLSDPAVGRVGVRAIGAGLAGLTTAAIAVVAVSTFTGTTLGDRTIGVVTLGGALTVLAYAVRALSTDPRGRVGLFAPFVLLAGGLAGYLFHREFVIVADVTLLLYGVVAVVPGLAFAAHAVRTYEEGRLGLVLPLVPAVGALAVTAFHRRYVIDAPTVLATFGVAIAAALGAYAWYVSDRDRPGRAGLLLPVVAVAGLLGGLRVADRIGAAAPDTWIDVAFLTNGSHYEPELTGIHPALIGSLYLMFVVTFVAFPLGVGAAIYLEEYAPDNRFARLLEINIANLAGVPSVVYGLLGVAVFIRFGGLSLGAVVAGGFTLSLLILPIVIVQSQEAIRAVPDSLRRASYGMGATRWQTIRNVVLPEAVPGILTGTILALGRAIGETAPLIMVGLAPIAGVPNAPTDQGTAMPLQVFAWSLDPRELFREHVAAAGAMTLLVALLAMNALAIVIRNKYQTDR